MAIYVAEDLQSEDDGDLVVSNGDLAMASVQESLKQYLLTWTLTTRGGFTTTPEVGWGAEGFIGRPNIPFTHEAMEKDLGYAYNQAEDMNVNDMAYVVSYVDTETAAATISLNGLIFEKDGSSPSQGIVMTFSFPFYNGQIQQEVQS